MSFWQLENVLDKEHFYRIFSEDIIGTVEGGIS
jgi:hypothetical protein